MKKFSREDFDEMFKQCSICSWMTVDEQGHVIESAPIPVDGVIVTLGGHIEVEWEDKSTVGWEKFKKSPLNEVSRKLPDGHFQGAFTSVEKACEVVRSTVENGLNDRISKLEAELKACKKELEDYGKVL